jgi:cytochrome c oxidase subunit 2
MTLFNLLAAKYLVLSAKASDSYLIDILRPPVDISVEGHRVDHLFNLTTGLITFFFILVCIGLFGFSYLYNQKRHPKPLYIDGTSKKHILIVAFLGSMVFVMIDMQITSISNTDYMEVFANWPKETENVEKIEVMGQQWAWNFRYAGKDGLFNTEDDIVTLNELRVPVGKKIVFQITSKDVIHSFSIPNVRLKVDAMPGRLSRMWTQFTTPGIYTVACTEMCGTYHYRMQAKISVYSEDEYKNWLANAETTSNYVVDKENPDLFWGWKWMTANN